MAVFISASPNPVPGTIWSISRMRPTTISWDVGGGFQTGTVYVSVDSGPSTPAKNSAGNPIPAGRSGSANVLVELGKTYVFQLKDTATPTIIFASVTVETRETLGLPTQFVDDVRARGPLIQGITNLQVFPDIESVRIRFRTRQPTVPVIDVKRSDNQALAGAVFPFLQGARTAHDFSFPLAQNTDFTFHIVAVPGNGAPSTAKAVETTGQFRTGLRNAQVFFDQVFVHTDGDPGLLGDGDFTFGMGAGDIDGGAVLGGTQYKADISGGDNQTINQSVLIEPAPVGLWVQVRSEEDDSFGYHFTGMDAEIAFAPEGAKWEHAFIRGDESEISTVTKWFDLSGAGPIAQEIAFTLETGPRHVDYSLHCRLRFQATPGAVLQPMIKKSAPPISRAKTVATMVTGDRIAVAGRQNHVLQLPGDGGLYHAEVGSRADSRNPQWTRVATELRPPLTVTAAGDTLQLVAVDDAGQVMHQELGPAAGQSGYSVAKAASLGGNVVAPIVAATVGDRTELFAMDAQGAVLQRTLGEHAGGEWKRIGEGLAGSLNAFTTVHGEIGLIARGRNGDVMYLAWSEKTAQGGTPPWQSLGKAPAGAVSAEQIEDDVVLAVLADDETVHAAAWRDYPKLPSKLVWQVFGTMNDLISARFSLVRGA
ncbi:MAG: hypothetical protein ABI777_07160 [Betaproteobacteria bacterium]